MRCLVVNMYYPPHLVPTAHYLRALCERLASRGWAVRVITSREDRSAAAAHGTERAVEVVRVWGTGLGKASCARRLTDYLVFYVLATWKVLRSPDFDIVVCMTSPPLVDLAGVVHRALFGSRLVLWSMDCYPELLTRVGMLDRGGRAYRALRGLRGLAARRTDLAFAIDDDMAAALAGEGYRQVRCVHNWCHDGLGAAASPDVAALRARLAGRGEKLVLYLGNLGPPHELETLLDIAQGLRHRQDIRFVFLGGGASWAALRCAVASRGLGNVTVGGTIAKELAGAALRAADILLMCLRPEIVGAASPSRLYSALRAGRPVLFVGPGDSHVGRVIRASGCGAVVAAGDATCGRAWIERLFRDGREGAARLGSLGTAYYDRHFGEERSLGALETGLAGLCERGELPGGGTGIEDDRLDAADLRPRGRDRGGVSRSLATPLGASLCLWLLGAVVSAHSVGWGALLSGAGGVLLYALSTPLVGGTLLRRLQAGFGARDPCAYPCVDAIVVLGAGVPQAAAPTSRDLGASASRLLHGMRLHRAGRGRYLLVSGGQSRRLRCGEAEAPRMKELALEYGVEAAAVLVESRSGNTRENARFSGELLREKGLRSVLLVTSPWHMARAVRAFRKEGIEVIPAPTDATGPLRLSVPALLLPCVGGLESSTTALKEYLGQLWLSVGGEQ